MEPLKSDNSFENWKKAFSGKKSRQKISSRQKKFVHNSGSRASPDMIPVGKWIIFAKQNFPKPQNGPGRLAEPKNDP